MLHSETVAACEWPEPMRMSVRRTWIETPRCPLRARLLPHHRQLDHPHVRAGAQMSRQSRPSAPRQPLKADQGGRHQSACPLTGSRGLSRQPDAGLVACTRRKGPAMLSAQLERYSRAFPEHDRPRMQAAWTTRGCLAGYQSKAIVRHDSRFVLNAIVRRLGLAEDHALPVTHSNLTS